MSVATLSTRGQIVIPVDIRHIVGWQPGDEVVVTVGQNASEVRLTRKETLDEMAERLSRYVKPGTLPLTDVHAFYDQREPRL